MKISLKTPIAIVGLGLSGESALSYLLSLGFSRNDLITFDEKSPQAQVANPKDLFKIYNPQTLVVSPGVSLKKDWLVAAASRGVTITSEINLACGALKDEKIIGITGSVGKSTTTSLLGAALTSLDKNTFVGGNLGNAFCNYATEVVTHQRPRAKWIVLELSSYQLENCADLKLSAAAITYLTPNHLERYASLQDYYKTKFRILDLCQGPIVLNQDSAGLFSFKNEIEKIDTAEKKIFWSASKKLQFKNIDLTKARLVGEHNQQNLAVAAKLLYELGVSPEAMKALVEFPGLNHRMEFFGSWNNIHFVNDSKATSIESVLMAVNSCVPKLQSGSKIHLLLGGRDKNLPWENLSSLSSNKQIQFYFFGESKDLIPQKSGLIGSSFGEISTCLQAALANAKKQDWVLLSPGGTSLDQFKNFEERGDFFKNSVRNYYSAR